VNAEDDARELADELDRNADEMERRSGQLKRQTDEVRTDWERKRADEGVPGAPRPADEATGDGEEESSAPDSD